MDETTLLAQLKNGDRSAFDYLYRQHFRMVSTYVGKNNGNDEDAQDLFQDAIIALLKHLRKPDFNLSVKTGTYLYAIARNIWIKTLKSKGLTAELPDDNQMNNLPDVPSDDLLEKKKFESKHQLMKKQLALLGEECRKIIIGFYYKKQKLAALATELGYTNDFIRVKKGRCLNGFKKKVQADAAYQELSGE